jgi:hypothetical protein
MSALPHFSPLADVLFVERRRLPCRADLIVKTVPVILDRVLGTIVDGDDQFSVETQLVALGAGKDVRVVECSGVGC